MRYQLCDDLFTFRTELKKVVISIAKQLYGIFPRGNMMDKDVMQRRVADAASKLIKSGDYLRLPDSSEVSDEIMEQCIESTFSGQVQEFCLAGSQGWVPRFLLWQWQKSPEVDGRISKKNTC